MKGVKRSLFALLAGELLMVLSAQAKPVIEEIADPTLPDIAAVHYVPGKNPVILYNPFLCKQAGRALCEFYRYHEYGHIALRHHERKDISAEVKEEEADQWAARHAPMPVVLAAWRYFSSGGGATPVHGDGRTRAARLIDERKLVAGLSLQPGPDDSRQPTPAYPAFSALAL